MNDRLKVLIVDDRRENLIALRRVLSDLDIEVVEAVNGNDALTATLYQDFALAILDVMMPGMDGFELAGLLRGDPRTRHLPIIFLTAAAGAETLVFKGYETGAVDYIIKPYNPDVLLAKVRVFLELERKNAELAEKVKALAASEERYRSLVVTVPDIVYRIDCDGRFTFLNEAVRSLGYCPEQLIGRHFSEIMLPEDAVMVSRAKALRELGGQVGEAKTAPALFDERRSGERKTTGLEVRLLLCHGNRQQDTVLPVKDEFLCAEVNCSGIYSPACAGGDAVFLGTVGIIRDISERRAMIDALAAAKEQAESATRLKSEFLANMSHELRTPLNAIIGFSEVLKEGLAGELAPIQKEYATDIFSSGQHLLALINDILDLSKIEADKMTLDLEPLELSSMLDNSLSIVKEKAAAHGVELKIDVAAAMDTVLLDHRKTKQIVYNLLSNGVKFTPQGGRVTLQARKIGRAEIAKWQSASPSSLAMPLLTNDFTDFLELAVDDTGIGIEPKDVARLFQSFSQLDSSKSRRTEGTGLGLALVLKLTQLHGGTVAMASTPGGGSRFVVWLPWREVAAAESATKSWSETS